MGASHPGVGYELRSSKFQAAGIQRSGWQRPPEGMQILNVDASFIDDLDEGATGAVIRDASSAFVGATNSVIPIVYNATKAEAMALWRVIQFAASLGFTNLLIHSDSQEVVNEMKSLIASSCYLC